MKTCALLLGSLAALALALTWIVTAAEPQLSSSAPMAAQTADSGPAERQSKWRAPDLGPGESNGHAIDCRD
jgi:hypothetical protein